MSRKDTAQALKGLALTGTATIKLECIQNEKPAAQLVGVWRTRMVGGRGRE